jgi:UDPglucose--hexose-1-phosphate uridylyltransferase
VRTVYAARRDASEHRRPSRRGREESGRHHPVLSVRRAPDTLKDLAGTDQGTGEWINDIEPETAVRRLREAG